MGTFLGPAGDDRAQVCIGGSDYVCRVDPQLPMSTLQRGQRVLCNEAFAVVQQLGFEPGGPVVRVDEILADGRLRLGTETGLTPMVVSRSDLLAKEAEAGP